MALFTHIENQAFHKNPFGIFHRNFHAYRKSNPLSTSFGQKNEKLKESCPILKEYMQYVEKVRENKKKMPLEEAVEEAIRYCIQNGILRDFLLRQRAEVRKMSIYEYDQEREFALIRRDEREIGIEQGKEIGIEQGKEIGEKIGREKERQNIEKTLREEKENSILSIISVCQRFGGNKEQVISELMEQCHLTKEQAQEKLTLYEDRKQKKEPDR